MVTLGAVVSESEFWFFGLKIRAATMNLLFSNIYVKVSEHLCSSLGLDVLCQQEGPAVLGPVAHVRPPNH